ncbi:outer membrane protein assembly factor BamD [Hyphobacterium marinum]|uniref:Outer membrane protein assembly factor BamD n=1 Tax=Hyphobacterium marinum TaxID=3116574 RepID=A0ABU7LWV1_9PROT|nr:outer membrane protein assembly factor BamD [Hyphobacterium sp. Y6023]MEE2566044.1 outer membrane protein assembly factor BamD [Hyphobacterium sp. Y6023]
MPPVSRIFLVMLLALAAASCSQRNRVSASTVYVERPAETIYAQAMTQMERRQYSTAADLFDEVERQHPYSEWARRSMLMAAFANYQANNYDEAISDAERFISLHPGNRSAPYAYYLIAISHFERIMDVGRDQQMTVQAMEALQQVVRRYPQSRYAQDARLKIDMTRDHLAGKEMEIGRWYLRRGYHLAAINRFRTVVRDFQTTSHTPEALHRLVEAYVGLGVDEEASQVAAVLGYNFPGSRWYEDSYRLLNREGIAIPNSELNDRDPSYWRRALDRLFS